MGGVGVAILIISDRQRNLVEKTNLVSVLQWAAAFLVLGKVLVPPAPLLLSL